MKNLTLFSIAIIVVSLFSCQSHKPDLKTAVDKFADLECRAMHLREKRFALANDIRFTQDTLLHSTDNADTTRLKLQIETFNKQKDVLLKQSLSLADTIHNELNDLMKNKLTNQSEKAGFDSMLNHTLQQRGCLAK